MDGKQECMCGGKGASLCECVIGYVSVWEHTDQGKTFTVMEGLLAKLAHVSMDITAVIMAKVNSCLQWMGSNK